MNDVEQTIGSQYAQSPIITALIAVWNACIDPAADIENFYNTIWNVNTATGYGLDVWGRIVGVSRVIKIDSTNYFGFQQAYPSSQPFNQAPFYSGKTTTANYALSDTAFRMLIMAKAAANITDCSITSINSIMMMLFAGSGDCYVIDNGNMSLTYAFKFNPTAVQRSVILTTGILPRPAGVSVEYKVISS